MVTHFFQYETSLCSSLPAKRSRSHDTAGVQLGSKIIEAATNICWLLQLTMIAIMVTMQIIYGTNIPITMATMMATMAITNKYGVFVDAGYHGG